MATAPKDCGGLQSLVEKLTQEFCQNYNYEPDADPLPQSDEAWNFFCYS